MKVINPKVKIFEPKLQVYAAAKEKLCITTQTGHLILNKDEITYLVADGNYTTIYSQDGRILCSQTIGVVLNKLNQKRFIRIHKSHAINIDRLRRIDSGYKYVMLNDGIQLAISRSKKLELKTTIEAIFD